LRFETRLKSSELTGTDGIADDTFRFLANVRGRGRVTCWGKQDKEDIGYLEDRSATLLDEARQTRSSRSRLKILSPRNPPTNPLSPLPCSYN
jgi:hypothetical protein